MGGARRMRPLVQCTPLDPSLGFAHGAHDRIGLARALAAPMPPLAPIPPIPYPTPRHPRRAAQLLPRLARLGWTLETPTDRPGGAPEPRARRADTRETGVPRPTRPHTPRLPQGLLLTPT